MKHCTYIVELSGEKEIVDLLKKHLAKPYDNLSSARETCKSIDTIFGDAVKIKLVVVRNTRTNYAYLLSSKTGDGQ
jgi:hypothetical protein